MSSWIIFPLIQSLQAHQEVEEFREWLDIHARVSSNYVMRLYETLLEVIEKGEEETLDSQTCWTLIRPDDPYRKGTSDNRLRQYRNELQKKIRRFWLEKRVEDETSPLVRLLNFAELGERNLYDLLEKDYRAQLNKWTNIEVLGLNDLYFLFQIEQLRNQSKILATRIKSSHIPTIIERFIEYSLPAYLKMACLNLSANNILQQSYQPIYVKELLQMLKEKDLQTGDGLLYVYYHTYLFLDQQSNQVEHILDALTPANSHLSQEELLDIYSLLHNGMVKRMNSGGFQKWGPKMLTLYRWGADVKALLPDGLIDPRNYKNIVITAIRLERRQEALDFMEDFKAYLPKEAEEYYRFCKGYYLYSGKSYEQMKQEDAWSPMKPFKNIGLRISADIVSLQAEYEQIWGNAEEEEVYQLKERIHRLQRNIKSQKNLAESNKILWQLRLSFFKRLLKQLNKKSLLSLYEEIETTDGLSNRDWFLYQIQWRLDVME